MYGYYYHTYKKQADQLFHAYTYGRTLRNHIRNMPSKFDQMRASRGANRWGPRPTALRTELNHMKRMIAKNKPETKRWYAGFTHTATASSSVRTDFKLTELFHTDPEFGENVLGEKWRNLRFNYRIDSNKNNVTGHQRIIVYKPKIPGSVLTLGNIRSFVDPNEYTVYHDKILRPDVGTISSNVTPTENNKSIMVTGGCSLRNTVTTWAASLPRENDIHVAVLTFNPDNNTYLLRASIEYVYQNM